MKIILTAIDEALAAAWLSIDLPDVSVYRGSILDLEVDAIVSPANSFGFMDGGIDWVYTQHFGSHLQEQLQTIIRELAPRSVLPAELPVGWAVQLKTGNERIPWMIAAPTMRVPMDVSQTVNAYLATQAALAVARRQVNHPRPVPAKWPIDSIAFPGLCTGVGGMAPELCAKQVGQAIREFQQGGAEFPKSWREAQQKHEWLRTL